MKRILIILTLLIICFNSSFSKKIMIDFDSAQFRADSNKTNFELYYSFQDSILTYISDGENKTGEMYCSVTVENNSGIVEKKEWIVSDVIPDAGSPVRNLLGLKSIIIPSGNYIVKIFCKDLNDSTSVFAKEFPLNTKNYNNSVISSSDILLAQNIEKLGETTNLWNKSFLRDSLFVIPNPNLEFYVPEMKMNLYYCLYNNTKKNEPINYSVKIQDAVKREIYNFTNTVPYSSSIYLHQNISLDTVASGVYYVQIHIITGSLNKDTCLVNKRFYLINRNVAPKLNTEFSENEQFARSEFATMNEESIAREFELIIPIASNAEKEMFYKLTTNSAKQRFMFTFWKKRDIDSNDLINEALMKYHNNIDYANLYFSVGKNNMGWKTDRGRTLLKYGEPTTRDYTEEQGENRAYETWFYAEIQGGVYFYFVDIGGDGNLKLVSSTAKGEMRDDYWKEDYVPVGSKPDYKNRLNSN